MRNLFDPHALRAGLLMTVALVVAPTTLTGCNLTKAQDVTLFTAFVQDACPVVGLANGLAGSVCQTVATILTPLIPVIVADADAPLCRLTPITPDGVHGKGVVCAYLCGDMSKATPSDPCPAADALLRAAPAAHFVTPPQSRRVTYDGSVKP